MRTTPAMRRLVAQISLEPRHLILPMFIADDISKPQLIPSMPGVVIHTRDSLRRAAADAVTSGIGGLMLFGVPQKFNKDLTGINGSASNSILNIALQDLTKDLGDSTILIAETCLDEFTEHGHCGLLNSIGIVDNDATNVRYVELAISQAKSGAHIVSPSGMMDGQVTAIRRGLDIAGYPNVSILAYSAKFASSLYGPFREATKCDLIGNRLTYQQDSRNIRESIYEIKLDIDEGADMVMIKPAIGYLDIVYASTIVSSVPVVAYQVSGEYAMACSMASNCWIGLQDAILESLIGIRRAGASFILTYWASSVARWLSE